MTSLKQQIETAMRYHHIEPQDVLWVGSDDGEYAITWEQFYELMDGYPVNKPIADNLVIVGEDWWIERGCQPEQWVTHRQPIKRPDASVFSHLEGNEDHTGRFLAGDL